jgi:heat shock protein HslJ
MKKSILIITMFLLALTMSLDLSVTPALAQAPEGEEYTVQARDTLSSIAAAEYGNPQAFPAIVAATNAKAAEDDSFAVIDDPAAIVVGQKLWLPADPDLTEPAAPAPGERVTAAIELTTNPWLWQSFTDPVEQFDLDNPADYTITFNPDGTVNVKADCNNASGTYTAEDSGTLNIELGPMTRAACPPDSRSDEFVQNLGFVVGFFFENGFLYLDMMTDGGTFQLASAPEFIPASDPGFGTAWDTVACDTFNVPATVAEYSDCGYVTVPEFHSQPDGPTIQVAVVRARSNGDSPAADPLFMEQGGPGGSSIRAIA